MNDNRKAFNDKFGDLLGDKSYLRKHDHVANTNETSVRFSGVNGLFTDSCRDRNLINTILTPMGLDLPAFPTLETNPVFSILSGYSDEPEQFPQEACEPAVCSGTIEVCDYTFPLGRKLCSTPTIDPDEVIKRYCRSDTRDMRLIGGFARMTGAGGLSPDGLSEQDRDEVLNNEIAFQMSHLVRAKQRWVHDKQWTGDPNNPNQSNGYKEFKGLDLLIGTGQLDINGDPCPALDSDIKDFGGACISDGTANIHRFMSQMARSLQVRANRQQIGPVDTVIVMREEMWHELTIIWPLYEQYQALAQVGASLAGATYNVDSASVTNEAIAMRSTMSLRLNGISYPVVIDDALPRTQVGDVFTSSIYFIPLSIMGGQIPVTYWEYLDYREIGRMLTNGLSQRLRFWTSDGRFLWTVSDNLFCFNVHCKFEPRLVMRTPWLAGRIDNVGVCPLQLPGDAYLSSGPGANEGYIHLPNNA